MKFFKPFLFLTLFQFITMDSKAHFIELIPSDAMLSAKDSKNITLETRFSHPFERGPHMEMVKPDEFGVLFKGKKTSLLDQLRPQGDIKDQTWEATYPIKRTGDYIFYIAPKPYFEPSEDKFILHYTKTVVHHEQSGEWHSPVGFPIEIQPLSRPYGLWTQNLFRARVLQNGNPVPFVTVEIEYKNTDNIKAPHASYGTQEVMTDANGVFAYSMARAGWWGFAALIEDGETLSTEDGTSYPIEKGALIWVKSEDMP